MKLSAFATSSPIRPRALHTLHVSGWVFDPSGGGKVSDAACWMHACLLARNSGIEKVELEVFSDNLGAVRLYESFAFSLEGVKVRGRKLDGRYQDVKLMALWL